MKGKIAVITLALMLIAANLYATGDLVVTGNLGVGTATPASKIDVSSTNVTALQASPTKTDTNFLTGVNLQTIDSYSGTSASSAARALTVLVDHTGTPTGSYSGHEGANYQLRFLGSGSVTQSFAQQNQLVFRSNSNYSVNNLWGNLVSLGASGAYSGSHTITNYYGYYSYGASISQTLSGTNWRHAYFANLPNYGGTVTNVTGLWIDKQTLGTNNNGIVLNGDGTGADIVFGTGNNVKLYANAGDLYVKDAANNVTLLGPHDPVTGEWIFYSQNVKTGKTVRVNMEKLVRAVEKLTGEQFMVETLIDQEN
jgi:hypothetical protein